MKRIVEISCLCFILFLSTTLAGCNSVSWLGGSHTCDYKETYSSNYKYHWYDSVCHDSEEQYRLNEEEHAYTDFEPLNEGGFGRSCSVCGYTQKTPKNNYILEESEHGTVEIVKESSGRTIFLPKPDDGYYFSHWEGGSGTMQIEDELDYSYYPSRDYCAVQSVRAFTADSISTTLNNVTIWVETLIPIFTDNKNGMIDVEFNVYSESLEEVDVWYLPYCHKNETFSYYISEGSNVFIEKEEYYSQHGSHSTDSSFPQQIPYIGTVKASGIFSSLSEVNIYIKDVNQ